MLVVDSSRFCAQAVARALKPSPSERQRYCKFSAQLGRPRRAAARHRHYASFIVTFPGRRRFILSRPRLLVAGLLVCIVASTAGVVSLAARTQDRKDPQSPRVEYTVASASSAAAGAEAAGAVVGSRVAFVARRAGLGPMPETLTLVIVGSMLIGLAAAVRRTT